MKAVQTWIVIVFILFALVETFQWVKGFILPLPIYVFAGAFLAIASNYDKGISSLFRQRIKSENNLSQTATLVETIDALDEEKTDRASLPGNDE